MKLFNSAMQSFEQALTMVNNGRRTSHSFLVEASILQNIGAAYNDQAMYPEAMPYHKEAAAIQCMVGAQCGDAEGHHCVD